MAKPKDITAHLQPETRAWIANTQRDYTVDPHNLMLLVLAGEAWEQSREAEAALRREGLVVPGREGGSRPHPCVAISRDARTAFARIIAQLGLTDAEVPEFGGHEIGAALEQGGRLAVAGGHMTKRTSGLTKRRDAFTPNVIEAWLAGDAMALRLALKIPPWCEDPHEVDENLVIPSEDPTGYWSPDYCESYADMQQLRRELIEAAGLPPQPKESIDGDY